MGGKHQGQANLAGRIAIAMIGNVGDQFDNAEIKCFRLFRGHAVIFHYCSRPSTGLTGSTAPVFQDQRMVTRLAHAFTRR